jgi:hypothetical protein
MNFTVPVVVEGPVTVAVNVYVFLVDGFVGRVPRAIDDVAHVEPVAVAAMRLVAPLSTGVTRVSYAVPLVSPVIETDVRLEFTAWSKIVHEESDDFLYSTV